MIILTTKFVLNIKNEIRCSRSRLSKIDFGERSIVSIFISTGGTVEKSRTEGDKTFGSEFLLLIFMNPATFRHCTSPIDEFSTE